MTKDEALKQALEALEDLRKFGVKQSVALVSLREVLAQPVQEPVAKEKPYAQVLVDWFDEANGFSHGTKAPHKWVLQAKAELRRFLYPTPPLPVQPQRPWVGLTDEEVRKICVDEWGGYEQVRAIEAKLKEKNT